MKKSFEIAFAFALLILSIASSLFQTELFTNIIYAVVIPSFILSIISFLSEISWRCEHYAKELASAAKDSAQFKRETVDAKMAEFAENKHNFEYVMAFDKAQLDKQQDECLHFLDTALAATFVQEFCYKCKKACDIAITVSYTILVLSLTISPYLAKWLSVINLNCITLWSLTLLYLTLELKSEICFIIFRVLFKYAKKKIPEDPAVDSEII